MPNSIKKLEEAFKEGKYDQLLKDIYVDEAVLLHISRNATSKH